MASGRLQGTTFGVPSKRQERLRHGAHVTPPQISWFTVRRHAAEYQPRPAGSPTLQPLEYRTSCISWFQTKDGGWLIEALSRGFLKGNARGPPRCRLTFGRPTSSAPWLGGGRHSPTACATGPVPASGLPQLARVDFLGTFDCAGDSALSPLATAGGARRAKFRQRPTQPMSKFI